MKEFIISALPLVTVGISLAVLVVNATGKKVKSSYIIEGMLIGMGIGYVVCSLLKAPHNFGVGMLLGEAIGSCIKKNDKQDEKRL